MDDAVSIGGDIPDDEPDFRPSLHDVCEAETRRYEILGVTGGGVAGGAPLEIERGGFSVNKDVNWHCITKDERMKLDEFTVRARDEDYKFALFLFERVPWRWMPSDHPYYKLWDFKNPSPGSNAQPDQSIPGFKTYTPKADFVSQLENDSDILTPKILQDAETPLASASKYYSGREADPGGGIKYNNQVDTIQFSGGGGELYLEFDANKMNEMETRFQDPVPFGILADDFHEGHGGKAGFETAKGLGWLPGFKTQLELHPVVIDV